MRSSLRVASVACRTCRCQTSWALYRCNWRPICCESSRATRVMGSNHSVSNGDQESSLRLCNWPQYSLFGNE